MPSDSDTVAAPGLGIERTAPGEVRVRRALLSVSEKAGIVDFARGLVELGVEIVSTGGTARELSGAGVPVRAIEDFTGFPEMMDGRVKTLHPRLYAGLLALRDSEEHLNAAAEHGIEAVDLVCVNLYPFEQTVARGDATAAEVVENIDIGGPTMIRAAAKNHAFAAVVVDPDDYAPVLVELRESGGRLGLATRERLAAAAFALTARYDAAISTWFSRRTHEGFPPHWREAYEKVSDLRYGENPHQQAAFYARVGSPTHLLDGVEQLHGKELSFNNLLDLSSARELVEDFSGPACTIVKHNNPCGCALGESVLEAYERAFACDPQSAYGGVIALNRRVDRACAQALSKQFIEVLLAPGFDEEALEVLTEKKNVRLLELPQWPPPLREVEGKPVLGGQLVQSRDLVTETREQMRVLTATAPTEDPVGGPAVRLEGLPSRALQRDRARRGRRDGRHRRGPDEPRRRGAHRRREGPVGPARPAGGRGARLRRLLPLRRRPPARDRRRHRRRHPARGLRARRGGHRRRRRRGHRDGGYGHPPLPALTYSRYIVLLS